MLLLLALIVPSGFILAVQAAPGEELPGTLPGVSRTASEPSGTQGGDTSVKKLVSPLRGTNGGEIKDVGGLFKNILAGIVIPLTLAVGVLFIVLAGLKFVTATGNPEKLKKAKQNLLYTVIGVAVILSAEIILNILLSTLKEIGNVSG